MGYDLRLPNINGTTEKEQIWQIKSFLRQHIEQLQRILNTMSSPVTENANGESASSLPAPTQVKGVWRSLGLSGNVTSADAGRKLGCNYLADGKHIYVAFGCGLNFEGGSVQVNLNALPQGLRPPRNVHALCVAEGNNIAVVTVNTSGNITVDLTGSAESVSWVDGYIDFWI